MRILSREDYIARTQEPLDHGMLRYPHGISKAEKRRIDKRYYERKLENLRLEVAAGKEYDELFAHGKIRPPTDTERLVIQANGHPDNASVQACRRICAKRMIDWEFEYKVLLLETEPKIES